jgi:hypothetical protein
MKDDNNKNFIPHLAIDTKFFHHAFADPCMMENQKRSRIGVHWTLDSTFKKSSQISLCYILSEFPLSTWS